MRFGKLPLEEEEHVSQKSRVLLSEPYLQGFREDVGRPVFTRPTSTRRNWKLLFEPNQSGQQLPVGRTKTGIFHEKPCCCSFKLGIDLMVEEKMVRT
jgi:hypothetical protein